MSILRGRQAEAARNDEAVLIAARDAVALYGPGVSVAIIAELAGVGVGTLYRRHATKEALLQHLCILALEQIADAATEALADPDAWDGVCTFIARCVELRTGALSGLGATIATTAAMREAFQSSHRLVEAVVTRAHESGSLRADFTALDLRVMLETFSRRVIDDGPHRRVLAVAIDGLRADRSEVTPLPGQPTSWSDYSARWTSSEPGGAAR